MSMTNEPDPLGDMTPATFPASPDWWRRLVARLDEGQLEQLRAGELSYVSMGADGMERFELVAPAWLFGDAAPPAA